MTEFDIQHMCNNYSLEELVRMAEHEENVLAMTIAMKCDEPCEDSYNQGWDDAIAAMKSELEAL